MKSRHVRALAVFGIVLVTLTGARGSRGGGCDDDHGSGGSSSSSSSGGFGSSGGSGTQHDGTDETPAVRTPADAMGEVEVKTCSVAPDRTNLRGHLYISNSDGWNKSYDVTVRFESDPGGPLLVVRREGVIVGPHENFHDTVTVDYDGPAEATELRECEIAFATSTATSS
ncbi:hypothetical protein [Streptomyces sp. NPDC127084]|uniref:hypothetical protein n=1 Tax=Streptomyces sp. NPDC127084 TaxID=3347133 RepID=UPI003646815A